ncbi:MAG: hypothetical protein WDN76_05225 [Alphaproteobacteria bacterium]
MRTVRCWRSYRPSSPTTNLGIAGKLAVAALEVSADDNEEAHLLIASILRDFRALHGG